jgi:hypothetical protein
MHFFVVADRDKDFFLNGYGETFDFPEWISHVR